MHQELHHAVVTSCAHYSLLGKCTALVTKSTTLYGSLELCTVAIHVVAFLLLRSNAIDEHCKHVSPMRFQMLLLCRMTRTPQNPACEQRTTVEALRAIHSGRGIAGLWHGTRCVSLFG
jgi:hypothetical protein